MASGQTTEIIVRPNNNDWEYATYSTCAARVGDLTRAMVSSRVAKSVVHPFFSYQSLHPEAVEDYPDLSKIPQRHGNSSTSEKNVKIIINYQ